MLSDIAMQIICCNFGVLLSCTCLPQCNQTSLCARLTAAPLRQCLG